jgi:hypothetical protein
MVEGTEGQKGDRLCPYMMEKQKRNQTKEKPTKQTNKKLRPKLVLSSPLTD